MSQPMRKSVSASTDGLDLVYWLRQPAGRSNGLLLFLHGGASNHTRWSEFVEHTRLAERWDIAFPDLRGNGETMTRRRLELPVWCADARDVILAEGADRAVLIGHSLGAQIAIHFARHHADLVRGMILIDPVFQGALRGRQAWLHRNLKLANRLLRALQWFNGIGLRRRRIPGRDLRELDEETRRAIAGTESFEAIAKRYGALGPILKHTPTANYLRQALATIAPLPALEDIGAPTLALLSGGSTLADLDHNRSEVARLPQAETIVLPANHWPLTETPEETREAIEDWVTRRFGTGR